MPSPLATTPRTTAAGMPAALPITSCGRAGDLVRDGDHGRVQLVAGAVALAVEVEQRREAGERRSRRRSCPGATARPNESLTITPTSPPVSSRSRSRSRAAEASGSTGRRTSVPAPGAFEASTPADAQTKPCLRLGDDERRPRRGRSAPTRAGSPRPAAGRRRRRARVPRPTARRRRARRRGPPPSRRPSARRRARPRRRSSARGGDERGEVVALADLRQPLDRDGISFTGGR